MADDMTQLLPTRTGAAPPCLTVYHDFRQAARIWRSLECSAPVYVFQTYDWLLAWHQTVGAALGVKPFIVVASDAQDQVSALFPLGIRRRFGCRILEFLGAKVSDYNVPLFVPHLLGHSPAIEGLWDRVVALARPDLVQLRLMPESLPGDLPNPMATAGRARHMTNSYETSLPATFSSFSSNRKGTYFKTTRRSRRKLDTLGEVRLTVHDNPDDIIRTVNLLLAQKRRKYGPHYVAPGVMPAFEEFYRKIARAPLQNGRSVTASLCVNDIVIATGFGMLQHRRFYILMLGHETGEWAALSPGRLFIWELVHWCIDQGIEMFDFTIGDEDYKSHWSDRRMRIFENQYPLNAFGAAFLLAQQLNAWRQRSR